jgi:hypothetical protein
VDVRELRTRPKAVSGQQPHLKYNDIKNFKKNLVRKGAAGEA